MVKKAYDRFGLEFDLLTNPEDHFTELTFSDELSFNVGQLYIAPCVYPPNKLWHLETLHSNPGDELKNTYVLKERTKKLNLLDIQKISSFPLKILDLRKDEELMISKFKYRRVIVLNVEEKIWEHQFPGMVGFKKKDKNVICLPLCTTKEYQDDTGFILDVQAFKYEQFFYIPPCSKYDQEEAITRFDLIQTINAVHLIPHKSIINSKPVALSDSFRDYLLHWLNKFYTGVGLSEAYEQDISTLREFIESAKVCQ